MDPSSKKRLFLIDGYALVYRAHFAMIRNPLITSDGRHTSALFGFINSMFKLLRDEDPDHIVIVFDGKEKTFRHEMYPQYKATREKMPDELRAQLPDLWKLTEAMKLPRLEVGGYEADDVIGALAVRAKEAGLHAYIVSGDKDFMQLVNDSVFMYSPGRQSDTTAVIDGERVKDKWGVEPGKITDLFGLMGDSSDNVPGVPGVGEKTALKLLQQYGSFDSVLEHAHEVQNKRAREGLINGEDVARLSKELVTIRTDVPLEVTIDDLERRDFDFEAMVAIFHDLEFFRLQGQLNAFRGEGVAAEVSEIAKDYTTVNSMNDLKKMIASLESADLIAMDIESTSTDPMRAEIVGVSFSVRDNCGWYVPILFPEKRKPLFAGKGDDLKAVLKLLQPLFEDSSLAKCGQNVKYDMLILKRHGIDVHGVECDTMLAAHLLKPEARSYKLDYLSQEHLHYHMQPITDLIGKGKNQLTMDQVELDKVSFYAAEDADVCRQLVPILKEKLEESDLSEFYSKVEAPLIPVLLQMEYNGVYVDEVMMKEMSVWMEKKLDTFTREIYAVAGTSFNLNSPQQLAVILFDTLKLPQIRRRSTNVNVLGALESHHPLPAKILEYRKFQKLKSTYVDAIPKLIHTDTGRIHSSFSQTVAATGRLASSNPNFQNIPIRAEEGREIRKAFRPQEEGWVILSADYSQIELRIMAHLSGDETLKEAFAKGEDIHAHTAGNIFGVEVKDVLQEMRRTAKVVNFGVMYGAGPFRMSQELGIPLDESRKVIEAYFARYAGIRDFIDATLDFARKEKYVQTMLGRRRYCYDIDDANQRVRSAAERATINMPIQGTAAEMIKLAMIKIHQRLKSENFESRMILQIHDELLFEVPQKELDRVREMVVQEMEAALALDVPVVVDWGIGESWFEAH
ncbi:MAG: DNA polymerase I [Candidatus Marinimicrobia bacterium]|nr:DNA polymerase I [Candidatus Neomarinimicrobiota bacterium]MDP6837124.1 DNA polymerase I [Candidatus Neomarinimicrobiota bacterium]